MRRGGYTEDGGGLGGGVYRYESRALFSINLSICAA